MYESQMESQPLGMGACLSPETCYPNIIIQNSVALNQTWLKLGGPKKFWGCWALSLGRRRDWYLETHCCPTSYRTLCQTVWALLWKKICQKILTPLHPTFQGYSTSLQLTRMISATFDFLLVSHSNYCFQDKKQQ